MIDYSELKRLAEAFPASLDWDSNTEPFFNGPSGESLGGGSTGFYCVYGQPFEIDGDTYDGNVYVPVCAKDFAKFVCSARDGVLALIAEYERSQRMLLAVAVEMGAIGEALGADMNDDGDAMVGFVNELKAENEALRKENQALLESPGDAL